MISSFAPDSFNLLARFLGLLHLEERDRQRKARPEVQLRIKLKGGSEFGCCNFVSILLERVVSSAQMSIQRVCGRRLCGRLCLRFRTCAAEGDEHRRG